MQIFVANKGFSKRVIALQLAGKLLKTQDTVRLALAGFGTVDRLFGINWDKGPDLRSEATRGPSPSTSQEGCRTVERASRASMCCCPKA